MKKTVNQLDLIYIFRIFHPIVAKYTFCSSSQAVFTKLDHILDHKHSLTNTEELETHKVCVGNTKELN
jgi:hypothetical protein